MRNIVILIFSVFIFTACTDRDDEVSDVQIRIKNNSSINFERVVVGDQDHVHLDVAPDSFSEYLGYETAYTYAFIEVNSGSATYLLQPIDFVGETPLDIGFYTYELDVTEAGDVLLNFVRD